MKPTLKVTITSAIKMTDKQVNSIVASIEKKHKGHDLDLKKVIDPSVIGGLKLTIGAEEIDATIYTKLEKLHTQLRENI